MASSTGTSTNTDDTGRAREWWADNLRVVAITGVIVVHTATGYLVDIPWYYDDERATSGFWSVVVGFPVFAGGLFWLGPLFLVAGWFSVRSLARSGPGGFARGRLLRLGVPLLTFVLVVQPLTDYVGNLRDERGSFLFYLARTEVGPMWFVAALLVFSLAYAALRAVRPPTSRRPAPVALLGLAAAVTAAVSLAVWQVWPVLEEMVLNLKVGEWPQGAALFALGVLAGETGWVDALPRALVRRIGWVAAGAAALMVGLVALGMSQAGSPEELLASLDWPTASFAVLDGLVAVTWSLWFVCWFRRRWDGHGRVLDRAARASYAAYVLHPLVLTTLMLLLATAALAPVVKFVLVAAVGVPACFAVGHVLTRVPGISRVV